MRRLNAIKILTPVYNDWPSLGMLINELDLLAAELTPDIQVTIINDGSNATPHDHLIEAVKVQNITQITQIDLLSNVGNQRAVAIGLSEVVRNGDFDALIIMDSDGEDRVADIPILLELAEQSEEHIVVAERATRSSSVSFKIFYFLYRLLFRVLTGKRLSFGNFSVVPYKAAQALASMPELWSNLPSTILRSRFPIVSHRVPRGMRYEGDSKMNTVALIVHGLSVIAAYSETLFVRILLGCSLLVLLSFLAIIIALAVKFFTDLAIPGWTSNVVLGLSIILIQTIFLALTSTILLLQNRMAAKHGPIVDSHNFISRSIVLSNTRSK